jgi:sterol 3beta-glucosyltransferase
LKDGHKVVIITHAEFKEWVEGYGIEHRQAGGDPTVLMKFSSDHSVCSPPLWRYGAVFVGEVMTSASAGTDSGWVETNCQMLSPGFFKEALGTMRQWLDDCEPSALIEFT